VKVASINSYSAKRESKPREEGRRNKEEMYCICEQILMQFPWTVAGWALGIVQVGHFHMIHSRLTG
jgi:hypothetical protein